MSQSGTRPQVEEVPHHLDDEAVVDEISSTELRAHSVERLRLLWNKRIYLGKAFGIGLIVGLLAAFLIPSRFEATTQLMPPDSQGGMGATMLAALAGKAAGGGAASTASLGSMAGELLGMKSSGALFIGVLGSRTVLDRLVQRFDLRKVYSEKLELDARKKLADRTTLSEDHKSGILTISVWDRDPNRASALAAAYVEELNQLVTDLSTSSAHRERVFLEGRLIAVKKDLDDASVKFSQFASKNAALDIKEQSRAMVDAASRLQGEKIAAESELKGLEEIYTSNNIRVRAVRARIGELQSQLEKLGGKSPDANTPPPPNELYPTIRELPVLGVTWADLYQRTKIQETVYEVLTQQYELAKVQEAKETPSVKVLDIAKPPEKKSFPPRTVITILTGLTFLVCGIVALFARVQWDQTPTDDPGKVFAQEVAHSLGRYVPWTTKNGSGTDDDNKRPWDNFDQRNDSQDKPESRLK
ncbi:MAG TPA: hypothetical protein VGJ06_03235 [Candidatus Acidoferrum sp.]